MDFTERFSYKLSNLLFLVLVVTILGADQVFRL